MLEHKWSLDNEKIELFMKEVVRKHLLPNARSSGASAMGAAEVEKFSYAKVNLADTFSVYRKSKYYYEGAYKFIHYTSVPKLLSIIKEKKIRLYDLQGLDDKDEFVFGYKILNENSDYKLKEIKKKVFCISMCKYELEESEESLNMWRQFGADGMGVGIVLDFKREHRSNWLYYVLSEVHYGDKSLAKINTAYEAYKEFKKKHNFTVSNFDEFFYKLFCFHKQHIYRNEKEVRLVYNNTFRIDDDKNGINDLTSRMKKTSYHELEIEWEGWKTFTGKMKKHQEHVKKLFPYLTIDKVVLGYRLTKDQKYNIAETLNNYRGNYSSFPKIEESALQKYF